jgi:tetratricopeptide (TPR) repeat protein
VSIHMVRSMIAVRCFYGLVLLALLVGWTRPAPAQSRNEKLDELRRAMVLSAGGQQQQARELVAAAVLWGEQQQDEFILAWAQMVQGYIEFSAEQWEPARGAYQQASERFAKLKERGPQATCLANLGRIALANKQHAEALPLFEQALQLQRETQQALEVARTLDNLARAHQGLGQTEKSVTLWQEALTILESGTADPRTQLHASLALGSAWTQSGQLEQAQQVLSKAARLAGDDPRTQVQVEQALGVVEHQRGQLDAAIAHYRAAQALAAAQSPPDESQLAGLRNNLGSALREKGQKNEALPELQAALQSYRRLKDVAGEARAQFNLALLQEELGSVAEAEASYRRVAELRKGVGDASGAAKALENLALLLTTSGQAEAARPLFDEARALRGAP